MTSSDPIYSDADGALANIRRTINAHRAAYGPPITEINVTLDQLKEIRRACPIVDSNPLSISALFGIPVILVDTVEESTLFHMTWESLVRRMGGRP